MEVTTDVRKTIVRRVEKEYLQFSSHVDDTYQITRLPDTGGRQNVIVEASRKLKVIKTWMSCR